MQQAQGLAETEPVECLELVETARTMDARQRPGHPFGCAQDTRCARKLVAEIGTIKSMDITVPVRRGDTVMELTVRTVARPDRHVAELLTRLGLELPRRNRILPAMPKPAADAGAAADEQM